MKPTLFELFGYRFHAYPTMLAVAFLTCTLMCVRDLQRRDPPIDATPQGGLWAFLGALIGAKAFWILQYSEPKYLYHAFFIWEGGLVFYGGLIGGVLAMALYVRLNRIPVLGLADGAAPYLALGEAITRIGCFLNGCCWGAPTTVFWAVTYPKHGFAYRRVDELDPKKIFYVDPYSVHPAPLYMVLGLVAVFLVLKFYDKRKPFDGSVALGYLFYYGIVRFTVEALRGDSTRSVFNHMTVSQTISLVLVLTGAAGFAAGMFLKATRPPRLTPEKTEQSSSPEGQNST